MPGVRAERSSIETSKPYLHKALAPVVPREVWDQLGLGGFGTVVFRGSVEQAVVHDVAESVHGQRRVRSGLVQFDVAEASATKLCGAKPRSVDSAA